MGAPPESTELHHINFIVGGPAFGRRCPHAHASGELHKASIRSAKKKLPIQHREFFFSAAQQLSISVAQHFSSSAALLTAHSQSPQNRQLLTPHHQSILHPHRVWRRFLWHSQVLRYHHIKSKLHPLFVGNAHVSYCE
ncbi:MAG: hypothetical protein RLZZ500_2524 [Bacteroidota bacterium]